MTIGVKFMKKLSMVQVIHHRNQALMSSKIHKKKMCKIGITMGKTCMGIMNLRI